MNKFGGLIYSRNFNKNSTKLNENDYLRLASTFHSIHEISQKICPIKVKRPGGKLYLILHDYIGIEVIETDGHKIHCFKALTGLMIFVVGIGRTQILEQFVQRVYAAYADFVLKNPFYRKILI